MAAVAGALAATSRGLGQSCWSRLARIPSMLLGAGPMRPLTPQPMLLQAGPVRWKHGAKPKQAAKKRFRLLKGGDIARGKAGQRHNTGYRSTLRMSRLRVTARVADSFIKRVRKLVTG